MSYKTLKIKMPRPPNFLRVEGLSGNSIESSVPIQSLSEEEIEEFAEEYKQFILTHYGRRKNQR